MRFSIRDILLLTVIVAVLTGWGLDRWRLARRVQELDHQAKVHLAEAELARAEALMQRDYAVMMQRAQLAEAKAAFQVELKAGADAVKEAAK